MMVLAVALAGCATAPATVSGEPPSATTTGSSAAMASSSPSSSPSSASPDRPAGDGGLPRPSEQPTDIARGPATADEQRVEMAFVGRVVAIDEGGSRPWITFVVERWFTDDLGERIGLWASAFDGDVGQDWLVASTRYEDVRGDVIPDETQPLDDDSLVAWEARFDGSVRPGDDGPERAPDPAMVARIDDARDRWARMEPVAWTAIIQLWERGMVATECGNGRVRTVVRDGQVVEAFDLDAECDVAEPATMDDLFDRAEQVSGAVEEGPTLDAQYGWIEELWASDRSLDSSITVTDFAPQAQPIARDPQVAALDDARRRWQQARIDDYRLVVDVQCFCGFSGPVDVEVVDGEVVDLVPRDPASRAQDYSWPDLTIDRMFAAIAEADESGEVDVSYDPDLGYPTWAFLDYLPEGQDDELGYVVSRMEPTG